jgi:hypothetical protein
MMQDEAAITQIVGPMNQALLDIRVAAPDQPELADTERPMQQGARVTALQQGVQPH